MPCLLSSLFISKHACLHVWGQKIEPGNSFFLSLHLYSTSTHKRPQGIKKKALVSIFYGLANAAFPSKLHFFASSTFYGLSMTDRSSFLLGPRFHSIRFRASLQTKKQQPVEAGKHRFPVGSRAEMKCTNNQEVQLRRTKGDSVSHGVPSGPGVERLAFFLGQWSMNGKLWSTILYGSLCIDRLITSGVHHLVLPLKLSAILPCLSLTQFT